MIPHNSNQVPYQQGPQTPVHGIQAQTPQTPVHSIQVPLGTDIERRDNRVANVPPLKASIPRNVPSKMEVTAGDRGVIGSMHSTTPSPTILFCFPESMDMTSQPRLPMETPPRRMSSLDINSPAGVFPMSPFPGTNNIFTSPSNHAGSVQRPHQPSYYADGLAPAIGNVNQHLPHPQAYYGPVPTNQHNSNVQTDSAFSHPMGQFQHQGPPPAAAPQQANYQYPLQPTPAQWGPAGYQYGSPVKAPAGLPPQYGQSPPTGATYVTNTAPVVSPAQYMPSNNTF